jgi:hypothetical protein
MTRALQTFSLTPCLRRDLVDAYHVKGRGAFLLTTNSRANRTVHQYSCTGASER